MNPSQIRTRADLLSGIRAQIERAGQAAERVAAHAIRTKNDTQKHHALDILDSLTEIARNVTALLRATVTELETITNTNNERPNQ
jgi:hypothetical protein